MVARATALHCAAMGDLVIAVNHRELDISQRDPVFRAIEKVGPDAVLNCAAYTNVDGAESDEQAAYAANAFGPENLAAACKDQGAAFITISTDYVFDGTKDGFHTEDHAPNPQSVYARSKYEGELRSAAANPDSVIVRSGWIFGHGGTNFLSVLPDLISNGRTFKAIDDAFGTPTFANDLAVRLRELASLRAAGVFHAANSGEGASYFEFAIAVAKFLNAGRVMIERISDAESGRPAARPRNSRLRSDRCDALRLEPLRDWKEALNDFLKREGG